jgi:hypothetical protein
MIFLMTTGSRMGDHGLLERIRVGLAFAGMEKKRGCFDSYLRFIPFNEGLGEGADGNPPVLETFDRL